MGTKYGTILVGGVVQTYNDSGPADDGSQTEANRVKYVTVTGDLSSPLHSAITRMDANILNQVDEGPTTKSTAYTTTLTDHNTVIECSGTFTLGLLAPSGNAGYKVTAKNAGSGTITVNVDGGANVDGGSSVSLTAGESREFRVNAGGTAYYSTTGATASNSIREIITTQGDIIRGDSSGDPERVALGSAGQVLESDGTDADWSSPDIVIITSGTVTSAASLDITDLSADYAAYKLVYNNLLPVTDNVNLMLRTDTNNGASFESGASDYGYANIGAQSGTASALVLIASSATAIVIGSAVGNGSGAEEGAGEITIHNPISSDDYTKVSSDIIYGVASTTQVITYKGGGWRRSAEANNAVQLLFSSGNIATMSYTLYGYRAS